MINGVYFDSKTSGKRDVLLYYRQDGFVGLENVSVEDTHFSSLSISSRVGNTPRYIGFPDGGQFETDNNDAVDAMLRSMPGSESGALFRGFAHRLESTKSLVATSVVSVVLFGWLFIQYGVPYFSKQVAALMPEEVAQYMGQGVLDVMDKSWFSASKLSDTRQAELRQLFQGLLENIEGADDYHLEFRLGGTIKANAFALPDGTIVMTDELLLLAESDAEIASVMLHEIGHLKHRHSLQSTIQQFSLAMFVMVITGDVSTSSSIITAIPLMLVESGFSRDMEWAADTFSLAYMRDHDIAPESFAIIMEKLEASFSDAYLACQQDSEAMLDDPLGCIKDAVRVNLQAKKGDNKTVLDYLSTHPATEARNARFR